MIKFSALIRVRAPRVHCSKFVLAIWYVLVLCCVVIFTSEMMHAGMDGYHEGDGSRAGILFYTRYDIQEEVATMDLD